VIGRVYICPIDAVAVSAVQDPFEINSASTISLALLSVFIGQSSDAGDAEDEQLRVRIIRDHSTSGSGGSSGTAVPARKGDAAFGGTVEINNTTPATGGSPIILPCDCFNVRGGMVHRPTELEIATIHGGGRIVVNFPAAPADALTVSGYIVFAELS
jgi:hypothetical protein